MLIQSLWAASEAIRIPQAARRRASGGLVSGFTQFESLERQKPENGESLCSIVTTARRARMIEEENTV
jgi:hypothetical protein